MVENQRRAQERYSL